MEKKIVIFIFILCLAKLYYIGERSLRFSPNILFSFYQKNIAEKESLGPIGVDIISIRNYFVSNNVVNFRFTDKTIKNYEIYYQRLVEFAYPAKVNKDALVLVSHNTEDVQNNCKLQHKTSNFNIYDCK